MADPPPEYRNRAYLAVAALVGFVLLYVALTVWFTYKGYTLLRDSWVGGKHATWSLLAGLMCAFVAVFLGKALLSIRRGERTGLVELGGGEPMLLEFVQRVADEVGAPRPHRIYLAPDVNAAVFYDLSLLNLLWPSRKNLILGLGLVNVLTLSELKAVLGHEFGHFAQRSMAVGRWIYTGQQIAAHIVGKRDFLDGFLEALSRIDIRIAWIGWVMRVIIWSVRSTMDQVFRAVVLAERALSRQMELQADLVAVTVSGSDALVHALHKMGPADTAWTCAMALALAQRAEGRVVADVFAVQTRVLQQERRTLADDTLGEAPPLPASGRAQHRIFEAGLGQPPPMWSTHPPNHVREDNIKKVYVPCELDDRAAWSLFAEPDAVRARMTEDILEPDATMFRMDLETSVSKVDDIYERRFLDQRYRGLYVARAVTRARERMVELYDPEPRVPVGDLYAESWTAAVSHWRQLEREHAELDAIVRGTLSTSGGVVHFRGRALRHKELPPVVAAVAGELEDARRALEAYDRSVRSAHWSLAYQMGHGWADYLASLLSLLHYAEHTEANVDDAHAKLMNEIAVVTVGGRASDAERRRVIAAAYDLHHRLQWVFHLRTQVGLPLRLTQRMGVAAWADALSNEYGLVAPSENDLGEWLEAVGGWFSCVSNPLGELRRETLETLLEVESYVAQLAASGEAPPPAPPPALVPPEYETFRHGREREQQHELDWWDRFVLAEGWGPGLARAAVAGAIVVGVISVGSVVSTPTVTIFNGLSRPVQVTVGDARRMVGPDTYAELEFEVNDELVVQAHTEQGELIEQFSPTVGNAFIDHVYNVGGATALVEWEAVYGNAAESPETKLGGPRWTATTADYLFVEPPSSVTTSGSAPTSRRVLTAVDVDDPRALEALVPDAAQREAMRLFHARWEPADRIEPWARAVEGRAELHR